MARTHKEHINDILAGRGGSRAGLWLGNPHPETVALYCRRLNAASFDELRVRWGDDCRWVPADGAYRHPVGNPALDPYQGKAKEYHGQAGVFAACESIAEVERYAWPDPVYLDINRIEERLRQYENYAVFSGMWAPFFHNVADFFGMENYFVKMYTHPAVVEAVTEHVVQYYLAANERLFAACGHLIDVYFFGNDFGSQESLLISPAMFRRFVLPYMRRLIALAKAHGLKVMLHSCGAIGAVIPDLLDAGIDALHPLQARARGMSAAELARYKNRLAYMGGVDTQQLLIKATPAEVRAEVWRLRDLWGDRFIVSPSHEAVLPNVPWQNLQAMAEAALAEE